MGVVGFDGYGRPCGTIGSKCSAQTSLYPLKSRSMSMRKVVTSTTFSSDAPASLSIFSIFETTALVCALMS